MTTNSCMVTFQLQAVPKQKYAVVGNTENLGKWNVKTAALMQKVKGQKGNYSVTVRFERGATINYRYFHARVINEQMLVNSWEALEDSRTLIVPDEKEYFIEEEYAFGNKDKNCSSDWLISQSELRLHFSCKDQRKLLTIIDFNKDEGDAIYQPDLSKFEVKIEAEEEQLISSKIIKLSPYHHQIIPNVHTEEKSTIVAMPTDDKQHMTYVFEHCKCPGLTAKITVLRSGNDFGEATISTCTLPKSKGNLSLPLVNSKGRTVAKLNLDYTMVDPLLLPVINQMEKSQNIWSHESMLLVGHRGCGNSFTSETLSNYRENSITSFKKVSDKPQAFVEFDVHLTKDLVPIVYHDLTTCVEAITTTDKESTLIEIPVYNILLEELLTMKTKHRSRKSEKRTLVFDEDDFLINPPFPTLKQVFEEVPESTGFNIELKYPSLDIYNRYEDGLDKYIDANVFVDSILKVVFEMAEDREIFFSSFDVDICVMARRKQNRYPVFLLICGDNDKSNAMMDLRERTSDMAIATASSEGFAGIDSLEADFHKSPEIVEKAHKAGLLMAFYGDTVSANLEKFDEKNVDVAIYDRIHTIDYIPKKRNTNNDQNEEEQQQ